MEDMQAGDGYRHNSEDLSKANARRPKVTINYLGDRPVQISRHQLHTADFGDDRRVKIGEPMTLHPGPNPGVDKAWFDAWLEENKNMTLVTSGAIAAVDEKHEDDAPIDEPGDERDLGPESAQREE